jgi:hypothetical protein
MKDMPFTIDTTGLDFPFQEQGHVVFWVCVREEEREEETWIMATGLPL